MTAISDPRFPFDDGKTDITQMLDDPQNIPVIEDMLREWELRNGPLFRKTSAAHMHWASTCQPRPKELARTMFVIDEHTTKESYGDIDLTTASYDEKWAAIRHGSWLYWFDIARKELSKHPQADRIRVVRALGQYHPQTGEVVLALRKKSKKFYVGGFCRVPLCPHEAPLFQLANQPEAR